MASIFIGVILIVFISGNEATKNSSGIEGRQSFYQKRITGADLDTAHRWQVAGTDLGIPYILENGAIGFLFGDTFSTARPEDGQGWRSPVMLRSHSQPATDSIIWDNAAGVFGDGFAPQIMPKEGGEFTIIPNDGISFPETGRQIVNFMSIEEWYHDGSGPNGSGWKTRYAGLAYSDNGNDFIRTGINWWNNGENSDPHQMASMQRDGDWVYVFSVRAGRQRGPMMVKRVKWDRMFYPGEYECWGTQDGVWRWRRNPCSPILEGNFGEPSVRLLGRTWVMAYLNLEKGAIVTRRANSPTGPWSHEKTQLTGAQESWLYGGFIHPWSSVRTGDLHMMVSVWKRDGAGATTEYDVRHYRGSA